MWLSSTIETATSADFFEMILSLVTVNFCAFHIFAFFWRPMHEHAGEVRSLSVTEGSRQPAISAVSCAHRSLLWNASEVSPEKKETRKTTSCSKQVNSTLKLQSDNSLSTLQVKLVTFWQPLSRVWRVVSITTQRLSNIWLQLSQLSLSFATTVRFRHAHTRTHTHTPLRQRLALVCFVATPLLWFPNACFW